MNLIVGKSNVDLFNRKHNKYTSSGQNKIRGPYILEVVQQWASLKTNLESII